MDNKYTLPLEKVSLGDIDLVGGKGASLGEMIGNLSSLGIKIPLGFFFNDYCLKNRHLHYQLIMLIPSFRLHKYKIQSSEVNTHEQRQSRANCKLWLI